MVKSLIKTNCTMKLKNLFTGFLAMMALVLTFAACGSDDSNDNATSINKTQLVGDWYVKGFKLLTFDNDSVTIFGENGEAKKGAYTIVGCDVYVSAGTESGKLMQNVSFSGTGVMTVQMTDGKNWVPFTLQKGGVSAITPAQLVGDWYLNGEKIFSFTEKTVTIKREIDRDVTFNYVILGSDIYMVSGTESERLLQKVSISNGVLTGELNVDGEWKAVSFQKGK